MITGRPVLPPKGMAPPIYHGFILNDVVPDGKTLHNASHGQGEYIASVFDVVHDAGLSTAMFASKEKFAVYDNSYNESTGAAGPHGKSKIDQYCFMDDGPPRHCGGLNRRFLGEMAERHFRYSFIHYRDTDSAGHQFGWESPAYHQAISIVDTYLAELLHFVDADPTMKGCTAIIVTTDHGGIGADHSDATRREDYTIPLLVWGAGVGHGDLYELNRTARADPAKRVPINGATAADSKRRHRQPRTFLARTGSHPWIDDQFLCRICE